MPLLAQVDPVVMTVNGYDVTQSEFEYFFEKNNIEAKVTKKAVRQYADLYLNFKLKVQAALDEGLDKSESFLSEYKMCRDMQAEDYVIDYDFLEEVARNSYEQSLIEIGEPGLMHVFVMSATPDANVGRTLDDCFEQMKSVYEKLQAGGSFQDLAKEYSTDNLAASGGEAGWLSVNQMPDDIADIILSLEPGQYSEPFVSNRTAFINSAGQTNTPLVWAGLKGMMPQWHVLTACLKRLSLTLAIFQGSTMTACWCLTSATARYGRGYRTIPRSWTPILKPTASSSILISPVSRVWFCSARRRRTLMN